MTPPPLVLVTGATGYIGGRLVPELLDAGYRVRTLTRHPERLKGHDWHDRVDVVRGDVLDPEAVDAALVGVDVAYYLIHSLGSGRRFERTDRTAARVFARAARDNEVGRIVYLGGLYPDDEDLTPHLESRREVGEILLASGVPTAVLRAAVIIGSGSASFEMLRYLTERLPVMVTPRWLRNRVQPIAIRDVLRYLVGVAALPPQVNRAFDIGGPDVLTYLDMMQRYAAVAGLPRRVIMPVNVLTPRLSAHWVGIVTPVPHRLARPLVASLVHEVVCSEHDVQRYVPDPPEGRIGFDRAVGLALQRVKEAAVLTRWSSASVPGTASDPLPSDPDWAGGSLYVDERATPVRASPEHLWAVIQGIGGENGWYSWPLAWSVRGWLDRFSGGPGLTRGRRDPSRVAVGDALDWWRVEDVRPLQLLRLRAEMKAPGLAWLELLVEQDPVGRTLFRQRALFHPRGLAGHAYWAAVTPFHAFVFGGMQANVALAAERLAREQAGDAQPATSQRAV
ncbi:SDR family oxidoreductase [Aquipuribacter sp. MA13-6]|uniref:SDR family oxidoreductase n=1 Tax=unclassified Aquipuribacter TaxID=2635084 RepID=UPI003EEEEF8D